VIYAFDEFELDDLRRSLRRSGEPVAIQAKVFGLLLHLIQQRGRVVSRAELLRAVWPDSVVSEAALSRAVKEARRAIGDDGERQRRLRTHHGEGFEFVGEVLVAGEPGARAERAGAASYVGRSDTLAQLEEALDGALAGRGGLVLLAGEPGLGKTRTAEELAARAGRRGARVLWGRCWEGDGAPALWPWLQLVRARARAVSPEALRAEAGAGAAELALLAPELRAGLGAPPEPPALEGEALRFRVFDAVAAFLRSVAQREPLLVVLDDLHCADAASLRLARFLARELDGARLLVLGTHRDREWAGPAGQRELLDALAREPGCRTLALPPLDAAETRALAEGLAAAPLPEAVAQALHARTHGNPLFIGETLRHWLAEGLVDPARGGAPVLPPERLPLGRSVRELIGLRVAALGEACLRTLGAASVLGRRFPLELLKGLPSLRRIDLTDALDDALAAAVLRECEAEPGALEFSHALVREGLHGGLGGTRRAELHREAGETLEKLAADDPGPQLERLAHHFLEAATLGDPRKAITYARRAAERASARGAYEEAAELLARASALLERDEEAADAERARLWLALGEARSRAAGPAQARSAFEAAAELAERAALPELLAQAALGLGTSGMGLSDPLQLDEGQVRLLEAAIAAPGQADAALRSRLFARLALVRYWPSAEPRCVALADEAVQLARGAGDAAALAQALLAAFVTRVGPDRVGECAPIGAELARAANARAGPELAFLARSVRLRELLATGEAEVFASEVAALERETRTLRQPQLRWWALVLGSVAPMVEGRHEESMALAREALALGRRMGDPTAESTFGGQAFSLALDRGTPEQAEGPFRRLAAERPGAAIYASSLALIEAETGRLDAARASLDRFAADGFAGVKRDYGWWTVLGFLAQVAHAVGDAARAAQLEALLAPFADRHVVFGFVSLFYHGPVARHLGLLAHTRGDLDLACARFEAAAALAGRLGARPMTARIQADHAAALRARGGPGDAAGARALAQEAAAAAAALGMARLAERTRALAA
jgi:DNA-binding winged helix-turn-helix (wHTH) protein/tetratricopeptide (TPR) repeat protein